MTLSRDLSSSSFHIPPRVSAEAFPGADYLRHIIRAQDLNGHGAIQMSIEGPVHQTHATFTQLCFNPVMAKALPDHGFILGPRSPVGQR